MSLQLYIIISIFTSFTDSFIYNSFICQVYLVCQRRSVPMSSMQLQSTEVHPLGKYTLSTKSDRLCRLIQKTFEKKFGIKGQQRDGLKKYFHFHFINQMSKHVMQHIVKISLNGFNFFFRDCIYVVSIICHKT